MAGAITAVAVFIANVFGPAAVAPIFLVTTTYVGVKLVSRLGKKFFGIRQPDPPLISHQIAVRGTREPRMIVYGETRVGGTVVYANTVSTELRRLLLVVAHTGHEIDSYLGWYLDDRYIDITDVDDINSSGDGSVDGDTASTGHGLSPQSGNVFCYLRGHLGAASQTADSFMTTFASSDWTSDHRGRGCAYTVLVADIIADYEHVWDGSAPQSLSAIVKGKKVYDPRLDSTFSGAVYGAGSGSHRLNDPSTWEWSDNPALCLADLLIDDDLGPGWATTRIDYDNVAVAADDCDEMVDIPTSSSEKRFTCNGALQSTDTHATNIGKLLSSMAGRLRYYGGQWHVHAGVDPGASVYDFTEADLIGPIVFRKEPERQDRYNAVTGWYYDPERNYKDSPFITVHDTSLRSARDNGKVLSQELALPMTNSEYMAQRVAFRALYQASFTGVCIIQVGYQGLTCRVGDLVTVTHDELGWSEKEFRVANFKLIDFRGVELTLKEDSADAYDDPDEGDYSTRSAAGVITFGKDLLPPRPYGGGSILADPSFRRGRTAALWDGADYANNGHKRHYWRLYAGTAIRVSGAGFGGGGALSITGAANGDPSTVTSIPGGFARVLDGEKMQVMLRIKKTFATSISTGGITAVVAMGDDAGEPDAFGTGGIVLVSGDINAWTVDEWQEYVLPVTISRGVSTAEYAIAYLNIEFYDITAGFVVDTFDIVRIGA